MRLRTIFFIPFCCVPFFAQADAVSELQARSAAVSRSIAKSVAAEQERNQERIKIQLRIDTLRSENGQTNKTPEERKIIQRELDHLQERLNQL